MTRRIRQASAVAAGTAIAVVSAGAVVALPATAHSRGAHHVHFSMSVHPRADKQVDIAPTGMSVGDEFFEHGTLNRAGDRYGFYALSGTLVRLPGPATPPRETQHFTLHLPGGVVEASGEHQAVGRFTVAVIGGTGKWARSRGTLRIDHGRATLDVTR